MSEQDTSIVKVCSFYVSDFHLLAMLLPHINQTIDDKIKIATILEEDEENKISELLNKLNLKNKEKILNIGWKETKIIEENIKKIIEEINEENVKEIIIAGSSIYIEKINKLIEKLKNNLKKDIKIINCYNAETIENIKDILNQHEMVLNTAGEKTVEKFKNNIR